MRPVIDNKFCVKNQKQNRKCVFALKKQLTHAHLEQCQFD